MKKIITLILGVLIAMPSFAQYETNRQRSRFNHDDTEQYWGFRLGLNIASLSSEYALHDMDSRTGIAVGAIYGHQLANNMPLWIEGGLFVSEKGGKTRWEGRKVTSRLTYLQVPVVCKYSFNVADDLFVQPFLGGYLALGLGGKTKNYGITLEDEDRGAHSSYNYFERFDGGLRLGCGAEYKMVYAELGFDFGLANIDKNDIESTHTRNFFINVGVNF